MLGYLPKGNMTLSKVRRACVAENVAQGVDGEGHTIWELITDVREIDSWCVAARPKDWLHA